MLLAQAETSWGIMGYPLRSHSRTWTWDILPAAQPVRSPSQGGCQAWGCPCHPPCRSPRLARQALPIQTSPNCPLPSFLRSWRDSRGISHMSLVLTERSASLGVPLWHGTARRQHSPAVRSATPAWWWRDNRHQPGHGHTHTPLHTPASPLTPQAILGIAQAPAQASHPLTWTHINGVPPSSASPRDDPRPPTPPAVPGEWLMLP